ERVRTLMLSIHGFTLAQLNAVSTDVPEILMTLADDGGELMLVRRQSIKGMRLYPTEPLLTFIEDRVDEAPLGLKRLYLSSLGGFAASDPARVTPLMEQALDDPDITVRYAALNLASQLGSTQEVQSILQTRLSVEPDGGLRGSIERQLAGN
ncbi:MAG: HEAT repeat domain-containing protein, partial [bacterium]